MALVGPGKADVVIGMFPALSHIAINLDWVLACHIHDRRWCGGAARQGEQRTNRNNAHVNIPSSVHLWDDTSRNTRPLACAHVSGRACSIWRSDVDAQPFELSVDDVGRLALRGSAGNARKVETFTPRRDSSGESRLEGVEPCGSLPRAFSH